jgi:hypothetical protein
MLRAAARDFYAQEVLIDSPVAYWRLGEASGTVAVDEVGNHDGTYEGTPTLGATGLLASDTDTAVSLSGDDYIEVADNADLLPTFISVEAWVKTSSIGSTQVIVVKDRAASNNSIPYMFRILSTGKVVFGSFKGSTPVWVVATSATTLTAGVIYHLVGTYDGANFRIYVDGIDNGATAHTDGLLGSGLALRIGERIQVSQPFTGTIDEVAVYDTALSPARIEAHYNAGTS